MYGFKQDQESASGKENSFLCARHKGILGNGSLVPLILNLGTIEWSGSAYVTSLQRKQPPITTEHEVSRS
jgi:hypothetical protein